MELRFEREHVQSRTSRLEARILELELLVDASSSPGVGGPSSSAVAASSPSGSKKGRELEAVIEGLERVISQQRVENQRLRTELDAKRERLDGRNRNELERLRKKVAELEAGSNSEDRRRRQVSKVSRSAQDVSRAQQQRATAQAELRQKEERILELEAQLERLAVSGVESTAGVSSVVRPQVLGSQEPADADRLREELAELRIARSGDAAALDEAQRALQEAELTERRYLEVARENRRLRADLGALEEEGFWAEIETLQARSDEGAWLARESKEALERLLAAFPSAEPPTALLLRLGTFAAAAAAA